MAQELVLVLQVVELLAEATAMHPEDQYLCIAFGLEIILVVCRRLLVVLPGVVTLCLQC